MCKKTQEKIMLLIIIYINLNYTEKKNVHIMSTLRLTTH